MRKRFWSAFKYLTLCLLVVLSGRTVVEATGINDDWFRALVDWTGADPGNSTVLACDLLWFGGIDPDYIYMGLGDDRMYFDEGQNRIFFGTEKDVIHFYEGPDMVQMGYGNDNFSMSQGDDVLSFWGGHAMISFDGGAWGNWFETDPSDPELNYKDYIYVYTPEDDQPEDASHMIVRSDTVAISANTGGVIIVFGPAPIPNPPTLSIIRRKDNGRQVSCKGSDALAIHNPGLRPGLRKGRAFGARQRGTEANLRAH